MKFCNTRLTPISLSSSFSRLSIAIAFASIVLPPSVIHAQTVKEKLVLSLTSPVRPGDDATIIIQTEPNATCQISVHYKSGPSKARGLIPKTADNKGKVRWTWRVGSRTTPGSWPITVTCIVKGTLFVRGKLIDGKELYQAILEVR